MHLATTFYVLLQAIESYKSGVIQTEPVPVHETVPPQKTPNYDTPTTAPHDLYKTRINFVTSEIPAVHHHSKIDIQVTLVC